MSLRLDILPEDVQREIFSYAFKCKREQNFYINKELCDMIRKPMTDCKKIICLSKPICSRCDSIAARWFGYMGCSLV